MKKFKALSKNVFLRVDRGILNKTTFLLTLCVYLSMVQINNTLHLVEPTILKLAQSMHYME